MRVTLNPIYAARYALRRLCYASLRTLHYFYLVAMRDHSLFVYVPQYSVLVCRKHRCAIYGLDEHLKRHHPHTPISQRRELLTLYEHLHRVPPADVTLPAPHGPPIDALQPAQDAFLCICSSTSSSHSNSDANSAVCSFISTSRAKMRQHINQQHQVKLTRWSSTAAASYAEHAAQLWQPVKVQTFFRERRYVRYFVVQEDAQEQQSDRQQADDKQGDEQQSNEQQSDYK